MAIGFPSFSSKPTAAPTSTAAASTVESPATTASAQKPSALAPVDTFEAAAPARAVNLSGLDDLSNDLNNNTAGGAGKLGGASGVDLDQVASKQDKINDVIDDALG